METSSSSLAQPIKSVPQGLKVGEGFEAMFRLRPTRWGLRYLGLPKNKTYPSGSEISKPRRPSCVSLSGELNAAP